MNLKKAKKIRRELFKMGVTHAPMISQPNGEFYNPYRRAKKKLIRERYSNK